MGAHSTWSTFCVGALLCGSTFYMEAISCVGACPTWELVVALSFIATNTHPSQWSLLLFGAVHHTEFSTPEFSMMISDLNFTWNWL